MNIDLNKIKQTCPKVYDLFLDSKIENIYNGSEKLKNVCYCDIENFFDEHRININIIPVFNINEYVYGFSIEYLKKTTYQCFHSKNYETTRDKAKEAVIIKAFEILENKTSEVK